MLKVFTEIKKRAKYAIFLKDTALEWSKRKELQRGYRKWPNGKPKTYCNILVMRLLTYLGYFIKWMLDPLGIDYTTPKEMMDGCIENMGKTCKEVDAEKAQKLANVGEIVIIISAFGKAYHHVALVVADEKQYDENKGPLEVQAGWFNGMFYVSDTEAWGPEWKDPRVRYFHIFQKNRKEQ